MNLITELLNVNFHDRKSFDCGNEALNIFLKQHANKNQVKNISKTFVAITNDHSNHPQKIIYGYYSLSAGHVLYNELPKMTQSKLPKYPTPIARINRLAVDEKYKGQGIGKFLLYNALHNILTIGEKMGIYAIVVDAKNNDAKAFYQKYGFTELQDSQLTLFLPLATIQLSIPESVLL